tara:strand:- start:13747 stop:14898 length:1152 start_codon:yes stop_codon:yes gene_type:complete
LIKKAIKKDDLNHLQTRDIVNILGFFDSINETKYCIIKENFEFPQLKLQSDIDVIVENFELFEQLLNEYFHQFKSYSINKIEKSEWKTFFDIYIDNEFVIRLDVYFKKHPTGSLILKKNFYDDLFSQKTIKKIKFNSLEFNINTASLSYDILIRIIELYLYPFKTHHKKYLNQNIKKVKKLELFIQEYIDVDVNKVLRRNLVFFLVKKYLYKFKNLVKRKFLFNKFIEQFFLKSLNFKYEEKKVIDIGWTKVKVSSSIKVPIETININLRTHNKLVVSNIENSPHYQFIRGYSADKNFPRDNYKNYLLDQSKESSSKSLELKIDSFIRLYDTYQKGDAVFELIVQRNKSLYFRKSPILLDGVHRLAILLLDDVKFVKCYISDN